MIHPSAEEVTNSALDYWRSKNAAPLFRANDMSAYENARFDDLLERLGNGETLTEAENREWYRLATIREQEEEERDARRRANAGLAEFYGPETTWDVHGNL